MKTDKTIFQLVVAGFFGVMFVIGFAMFATYKAPKSSDTIEVGKVVIWGTMDKRIIDELLNMIEQDDKNYSKITYVEKSKSNFDADLLEALATQKAPDLILLSNGNFLKYKNKIYTIPYKNISQRIYMETFADAFLIYLNKNGILGIPFTIDPMVLYYNKTLFASNRVVLPPKKWEELEKPNGIYNNLNHIEDNNLITSMIALGESININNYKEILYSLFFQKDNPIIQWSDGELFVSNKFTDNGSVIKFYTQFADRTNKTSYSWNKSKNSSQEEFIAGNLGMYLGFVSDLRKIKLKNPNLNFFVSEMPNFQTSRENKVYAKTWVLAIPMLSKNKFGAYNVALKFASKMSQEFLSNRIYLPPVRKDMLSQVPDKAFLDIFYKEAIYGQTILEPSDKIMNQIFSDYINDVNTNLRNPVGATSILQKTIDLNLKKFREK